MIMFNLSSTGMFVYREVTSHDTTNLPSSIRTFIDANAVVDFLALLFSYVMYNVCHVILKIVNGQSLYDGRMIG